jgi:gliding motility-associated-like protein
MWSFTVDDGNGCPYTVSGGPFPPLEDPGFSYTGGVWCTNDPNQNPTITGVAGGTFTATPAGLSINAGSGQINTGASTPGTYDVTYTTPGVCFDDSTVTVVINPVPTVDPVADQTICEGTNFTAVSFTGTAGATFDWTNANTNIGLGAAGTGDIASFTGTSGGGQEVSNLTVTPTLNGCVGNSENWLFTVNPQEDAGWNYPQTAWCTSEAPAVANITGTAGGTFSATPAGLTLDANTGQVTPATSTPGTYDVTYTTAGICFDDSTITINIASTPSVDPVADQTICEGTDFALIDFTGSAGSVFDWVNDNTNIGLAAAGTNDIAAFTGTTTGVQEVANITVTPSAGSCVGTPESFVLTVNTQDDASFTYPAAGWCTSDVVQNANVTGTAGGTFTSAPAGLTLAAATGDITPGSSTPGTYDVTYTTAGVCPDNQTVTIDIYEVPVADPVADQTLCVGDNTAAVNFTSTTAGTTFDWTNSNTNVGLAAAGTGDIASFVAATSGGTEVATVTVTPSTVNCVGTDITFDITVNDLDDASFNYPNGLTYCQTGADPTANVTGLAGGTFSYVVSSGGPNLVLDANTGAIDLDLSDLGAYDITYNTATAGGSLCPQTTTVTLTITDAPAADFTLDIYCANDADPVPTFINGGSAGAFSAAPAGLVINANTGEVDLDASTPGTYTVTNDVNIAGCALASHNDDITINELPNATISGGGTVCPSDPLPDVNIDFTSGAANWNVTYTVDGTPTTQNGVGTPFTISNAAVGTYDLVSVTDANGCTNTAAGQVIVDQLSNPVVDPLVNQFVCEGDDLLIQNFVVNPANANLDWTSTTDVGFGLSGSGQIDNFTSANGTGVSIQTTVAVTPTSVEGCVGATENFIVQVNPLPTISFTGGPLTGCEPLEVTFENTTTPNSQICLWDFGDGNVVAGCGQVTNIYNAGTYDVTLTVTTSEGCTSTDTYNSYVDVSPQPFASFSYSPQEITVEDPVVEFTNQSINADTYNWDFGDNSTNSAVENPIHLFPGEAENYTVTLWAYNNGGMCYDSAIVVIPIKDVLIYYVPNIFTPDGDDYNETFQPIFTSGLDIYEYHLTIFNRWGEIIFESYNHEKGWNGHYGDGGLVQDGVYVWQIEFGETMSDKQYTIRGHVTVLK